MATNKFSIGDNNTITGSTIQNNTRNGNSETKIGNGNHLKKVSIQSTDAPIPKEKWYQKITWQLIMPIAVVVIGGLLLAYAKGWLGLP